MARLPSTLDCTAGALLVRGLGEFGWDGAPTAKLRAAGTTYFESRAPVRRALAGRRRRRSRSRRTSCSR